MKVVIIEDETAAMVNLRSLISVLEPDCQVIATLESVEDSVEWFGNNKMPDIVFMDIHLADGDAFRIFDRINIPAPVIFTTAYDQYALNAFTVNSIDYLLKPIKSADLKRAFDKFRTFTNPERDHYISRILEMSNHRRPSETLLLQKGDKLIPVALKDIAYFYTSEERVTLCTSDGSLYPFDKPLDTVMACLPDYDFFRANRQFIISRGSVKDMSVWFGNRLTVNLLVKCPERIVISKARVPIYKKWISGSI